MVFVILGLLPDTLFEICDRVSCYWDSGLFFTTFAALWASTAVTQFIILCVIKIMAKVFHSSRLLPTMEDSTGSDSVI